MSPVTTIEPVTFDSTSSNLDERQKPVILTLRDRPYDKHTSYRLVLRDAGTGIEQGSINVIIDRAITDDFRLLRLPKPIPASTICSMRISLAASFVRT